MRALTLLDGALEVCEVPEPVPQPHQILARPLACGICGSDLHMVDHGQELWSLHQEVAANASHSPMRGPAVDPQIPVVLGHEFVAEVVGMGHEVRGFSLGDVVVSVPRVFDRDGGRHTLGYSATYPGGFGQAMVLDSTLALKVPTGIDPHLAVLTEPLAVAFHALAKVAINPGQPVAIVGCGPIGMALLVWLKGRGHSPVVMADVVAKRRERARAAGADLVVDPGVVSPGAPPLGAVVASLAEASVMAGPPIFFEAVGLPGILDQLLMEAPSLSQIVVVGACLGSDRWRPMLALGRELTLHFALGYSDVEFAQSLDAIADCRIDPSVLITGTVPLGEALDAFQRLASEASDLKVLVT